MLAARPFAPQAPPAAKQPVRPTPAAAAVVTPLEPRALLDKYCVVCHNDRLRTANLVLSGDKMDVEHVAAEAETWEKVVRKVESGAMPPVHMPRPPAATLQGFAAGLATALDRVAAANPNPGDPAPHRLNRVEYTNAIHDLLALDIDGRALLPPDDSGYGFDNIGSVLSLSPGLPRNICWRPIKWRGSPLATPPNIPARRRAESSSPRGRAIA